MENGWGIEVEWRMDGEWMGNRSRMDGEVENGWGMNGE